MITYSHADLVTAVETALLDTLQSEIDRRKHLNTLAAILNLHLKKDYCTDVFDCEICPTVDVVVDALQKIGALPID